MDKKFYKKLENLERSTLLEVDLFNIDNHEILVVRTGGLLSIRLCDDSMEPRSSWEEFWTG